MQTKLRVVVCSAMALQLGCSTAAIGQGGQGGQALHQGADDAPHTFTARAHPPRVRPAPPQVDVSTLPRLVERSASCYGGGDDDRPAVAVPPKRSKKKGKSSKPVARKSSGFVPYSPAGPGASTTTPTTVASKAKPSKTPAKPSSPTPAPEPVVSPNAAPAGDAGGASMADEAPTQNAPANATIATESTTKRSARKEEREAEDQGGDSRRDRRHRNRDKDSPKALAADSAASAAPEPPALVQASNDDAFEDWGQATYLSNDDSMSLSSAQRVIFAIDRFLPLPLAHIRPHELLNYFSFETADVPETDDFSVSAQIAPDPEKPGIYNLALAVAGRPLDRESRRNAAITFVVDRSGSMSDEGRMDYLKRGLHRAVDELKTGDMISLVLFDDQVCTPVENFVVGRDPRKVLDGAIDKLEPRGSTDVHLGLVEGYAIADRSFQTTHSNRVLLVTDALANTGVTDTESIALIGKHYDQRRIRLSGVGVGTEFNDELLDQLTEKGRGAYVFLGSPAEVDAVFGPRFISLIETVANDVHFQLHLPPSLRMNVFYGEESSAVKEDVQAIHYFANTSQLFLSDLMAKGGTLRGQDSIMLTVEYEDPESGDAMVEEFAFDLGEITEESKNIRKSRMLIHFVDGLASMAARPLPSSWGTERGSWIDEDASAMCEQGRVDLQRMSSGIEGDPEVKRVNSLWDHYCARFDRPRQGGAIRRASPQQGWPAASGK
jgi:von Willebrand factor type A domain